MSKFTVDGALLLQAVKAVLPHVPLDKDSDEGSCMHFNVTETAELLVTGDGWGTGACAVDARSKPRWTCWSGTRPRHARCSTGPPRPTSSSWFT